MWHARLGHVPLHILKLVLVEGVANVLDNCFSCMLAKQTRQSFPTSMSVSENLFDLVHADLWGPYRYKTHDNCQMFLTIVDEKSRAT